GSRRGSSSEGVRVKPSSPLSRSDLVVAAFGSIPIQPRLDRLPQRLRLRHAKCAMTGGSLRCNDRLQPELGALLEAPVGLRRLAEPAREADLAEGGGMGA